MKTEIKQLQQVVEQHDGITLKLNWDMLEARSDEKYNFYCHRDKILVGFLALYPFGEKVELCGMVHPDYRRQHIFTELLEEALSSEIKQTYKEILLNAPAASVTGVAFLEQYACKPAFVEYQMKYISNQEKQDQAVQEDSRLNSSVQLAPYEPDNHQQLFIELDVEGFKESKEEARIYYNDLSVVDKSQYFVIVKNEQAVGKIRISHEGEHEVWIYGFVISASMRGQGIGRSILEYIVKRESKSGCDVWLEVALDNDHARHLYESVGFKIQNAQDYYRLN